MAQTMWMVRSAEGGQMADDFKEKSVVAIGWHDIGDLSQYEGKSGILQAIRHCYSDWPEGREQSSASQLHRFRTELKAGDDVVTYDGSRRVYHVGRLQGDYQYAPELVPPLVNTRSVKWHGEVERDALSVSTRNSLGSTLTLFRVPDSAAEEILRVLNGQASAKSAGLDDAEETEMDLLHRYQQAAEEFVKDRLSRLSPEDMEILVAGLLRAMGYRTQRTPTGPDRGIDIMASPDGFGFESPRIIVEVKHRPKTPMGSQELRAFLGGRHAGDKGLFVSTGGFTKDARYEADRAKIPLKLMDLGELYEALTEHYDKADAKTRALLPLRKLYWPV